MAFDLEQFSQLETTESTPDKSVPIPKDRYQAVITKLSRFHQFVDKETNAPTERGVLDVVWKITDQAKLPAIRAVTNAEDNFVKQSIGIDFILAPDGSPKGIDHGTNKSIDLGRLRKALHQNDSGKTWKPSMLLNVPATIEVDHEVDKKNPSITYSKVKNVAERVL